MSRKDLTSSKGAREPAGLEGGRRIEKTIRKESSGRSVRIEKGPLPSEPLSGYEGRDVITAISVEEYIETIAVDYNEEASLPSESSKSRELKLMKMLFFVLVVVILLKETETGRAILESTYETLHIIKLASMFI